LFILIIKIKELFSLLRKLSKKFKISRISDYRKAQLRFAQEILHFVTLKTKQKWEKLEIKKISSGMVRIKNIG
jgi:hypothetical protein